MSTAAKVGINLLWLRPGEVGGSEQATVALLEGLRDAAPADLDLRLFVLPSFVDAHPEVAGAIATSVLRVAGLSRAARVAAEASWLAWRTRDLDLVHHAGGTAPLLARRPYVVTLHDLQPLERSVTHGPVKRAYLRSMIPASLRRARAVVVPSEFVRRGVVALRAVDPGVVVVVPHAIPDSTGRTPPAQLRERYGIEGRVVLYPAITYPHKNHATLLEAFALVLAQCPDAVLVLPGGEGASEAAVQTLIAERGLEAQVRRLGRIPEPDKDGFYALAEVVAVPSTYEGFGLPAVEALRAGVPLVVAAGTALPEVAGEAALVVDPLDVTAWAAAIVRLLRDPAERDRLVALGHRQVATYEVNRVVDEMVAVYRAALSGPPADRP